MIVLAVAKKKKNPYNNTVSFVSFITIFSRFSIKENLR